MLYQAFPVGPPEREALAELSSAIDLAPYAIVALTPSRSWRSSFTARAPRPPSPARTRSAGRRPGVPPARAACYGGAVSLPGSAADASDRPSPLRAVAIVAASLAAVAAIGWLDIVSGPRIGMSLFYLMPIVACGWWVGRTAAMITAVAAALTWLGADVATQSLEETTSAWNALTRMAIYVFVGVSVAVSRRDRRRLAELLALSESLARNDPLTGLANRRAFDERLRMELPRAARSGDPLCVAYLDLDDFKAVNDRYGHARGDVLLQDIAAELRACVRASDLPARLGGDELAILLVDVSADDARRTCERILERVRALGRELPGTNLGVSAGIAWFASPPSSSDEVLRRADEAMYEAKRGGKNRVVVAVVDEDAARVARAE